MYCEKRGDGRDLVMRVEREEEKKMPAEISWGGGT